MTDSELAAQSIESTHVRSRSVDELAQDIRLERQQTERNSVSSIGGLGTTDIAQSGANGADFL
jgi:hypothetical protein